MSDLTIPPAPNHNRPPRLALPTFNIMRQRPNDQPAAFGRWLSAKVSGEDWDRLPQSELKDLRTMAFLLEEWTPPEPVKRRWLGRMLGRVGL